MWCALFAVAFRAASHRIGSHSITFDFATLGNIQYKVEYNAGQDMHTLYTAVRSRRLYYYFILYYVPLCLKIQ